MLYDSEGNPVEGSMTAEEVEASISKALEDSKAESEAKIAELQRKMEENTNANLRKKTESREKENEDLKRQIEGIKEMASKQLMEVAMRSLGVRDAELRKKIEENYERLKPEDGTDLDAVTSAMHDAYKLSSDVPISALNVSHPAYGGGAPTESGDTDQQFSHEFLEMANHGFGLTKEDFKKYGDKIPKQYM
jgi:hypothetical protein